MADRRVPDLSAVKSPPRESIEYAQLKHDRTHIGSGGQGAVYRVNISSPTLPDKIAIKEPAVRSNTIPVNDMEALSDEGETWETLDRREREKQRWDDSEHIVGVIDVGDEPFPWIAMEYMDGNGLDDRLEASPNGGPIYTALWYGECICRGVEVAHNYGIAHLDLKPSNILFRKTAEDVWDVPKIADWGLSRVLTEQTGEMEKLSVQYAAPEQIESGNFGEPDMLTDVYQVGALVYAMLTGEPPYAGKQASVMHDIVSEDGPTPPSKIRNDLPAAIDDVVLKSLNKEKTDRYRNIGVFEEALREVRSKNISARGESQPINSTDENSEIREKVVENGRIAANSEPTVGVTDNTEPTNHIKNNSTDQDITQHPSHGKIPDYTEPEGTIDSDSIDQENSDNSNINQGLSTEIKVPAGVIIGSWILLIFFTYSLTWDF